MLIRKQKTPLFKVIIAPDFFFWDIPWQDSGGTKHTPNNCGKCWGNTVKNKIFFQLRNPLDKENSFIIESALKQNVMGIPGNMLRDRKNRRKSHPIV